jgi:hypothetical protein
VQNGVCGTAHCHVQSESIVQRLLCDNVPGPDIFSQQCQDLRSGPAGEFLALMGPSGSGKSTQITDGMSDARYPGIRQEWKTVVGFRSSFNNHLLLGRAD